MKIRKIYFILVLCILFFIFIFWGQYKLIFVKSSSRKLIGLWSTSQFLLNKDLNTISEKFGLNLVVKRRGFKISFVDKSQTRVKFSNSGMYYRCISEEESKGINIFIDEDENNNKNIASNLYYILLKCSLVDLDQNTQDDKDLLNYLMRTSSDINNYRSLFFRLRK